MGGIVRDILLKRDKKNPDIDFCLENNAVLFARDLARELRSGFVVLDEEHGCGRVVRKEKDGVLYTLDFTDFRGKDLKDDLLHRDCSINSMALDFEQAYACVNSNPGPGGLGVFKRLIIDPYGGLQDLSAGKIRAVNKKSFDEDPVRIMRMFSLSALFDFNIDKETHARAVAKKKKLLSVSSERVRDELFKVLSSVRGYEVFKSLWKAGILELIFPEIKPMYKLKQGPYHNLDVWGHTLDTVKKGESLLKDFSRNKDIAAYLEEEVSSGHTRRELFKLALLFHDIGKPGTFRAEKKKVTFYGHERLGSQLVKGIGERLKLSNEEIRLLRRVTFLHLRPGYMANNETLTPRAKFRFFRDAGQDAVMVLLLSLADQRATQGYLTIELSRERHERLMRRLIREYFSELKKEKKVRLVNGHDIIKIFKLSPSPLIGTLLRELEELQAIGKITTKKEALSAAAKIISSHASHGNRVISREK